MKERVILLHGIFRTAKSMAKLARRLRDNGYEVLNIDYPSTRHSLEELVDIIHHKISDNNIKTHFVGFSMGGLLIRTYLAKYTPRNLGRVVMIGPPNHGSEIADFFKDWHLFKKFWGPAGQQLITSQDKFRHIFGWVNYELGIIAGSRNGGRIFSALMIGKPSDGTVSIESTKLENMKEHIIIKTSHTFFPGDKKMWRLVANFLRDGSFTILDDASRDAKL